MSILRKHLLANFVVLICYQLVLHFVMGGEELSFLISSAFFICVHIFISIIYIAVQAMREKSAYAKAQAISIALILVVGFSTCISIPSVF